MKIRNQLIITIASFLIILCLIGVSIVNTNAQAMVLNNDREISSIIEDRIATLQHIADAFFLYQHASDLSDWQSNLDALYSYVTHLSITDSNQNQFSEKLWVDLQEIDDAFNNVVVYLNNTPRSTAIRNDTEFQAVWSNLSNKFDALSNDSANLTLSLHSQTVFINQLNILLIVSLLLVFAVFLMVSYLIMFRRALKGIFELDKDIKIIGTGNFDHPVRAVNNDEVSELANSVNNMRLQLKDFTQKLKDQERLAGIGQTAGMVGHDIRNPLQAIVGDLYLIDDDIASLPDGELKKGLQENVSSIQANLVYIAKIVEDLQDYAKTQAPKREKVEIYKIIEEVMKLIAIPSNIKVVIKIEKDFQEILSDFSMLKRSISNLVNNGVQAMPEGGQLTIKAYRNGDSAFVTVEDTGIGIPEEVKHRLFEPMFTTKAKGQGLGLAVVKRLVKAMNGTITLESTEGKGSKFTIHLPLEETSKNLSIS